MKIMSIILTVMMVLSCVPMSALNVSAAADLSAKIDTGVTVTIKDADGDGYYEIGTADELYAFAAIVNSSFNSFNAILTNDIVVNDVELVEGTTDVRTWTPMGDRIRVFKGTFDGNNKTISGLYYNNKNNDYVGLFAYVSATGVIKNVGVINSYFNGKDYVGGIVGNNRGEVTNCYTAGIVSGKKYVGGVIGYAIQNKVTQCYNKAKVNGENSVGGVIGTNNVATVMNCYNQGEVYGNNNVGGIAGSNVANATGMLTNCYNTGVVSGTSLCGGIIGLDETHNIANCYYLDSTCVGGVAGSDVEGSAEAKTTEQFESGEVAYLLGEAFGQTIGTDKLPVFGGATVYLVRKCNENDIYYSNIKDETVHVPAILKGYDATCTEDGLTDGLECSECKQILKQGEVIPAQGHQFDGESSCKVCGYMCAVDSDGDGFYEIDNATKLYWFAEEVNSGNTSINAILTSDIAVNNGTITAESTDAKAWIPIGKSDNRYSGTFNGNNKTVSGLYFNDNSYKYVGLFGYLTTNGEVKNVSVANSYFSGNSYVGSIVGCNYGGTVSGCNSSSVVNADVNSSDVSGIVGYLREGIVKDCYNTGTVSGNAYVGGVVGSSYKGVIENCYNTGAVNGDSYLGGVVGSNGDKALSNCYNTGKITATGNRVGGVIGSSGGSAENCYNTGDVSSEGDYVGGVVGFSDSAIVNFYNEGNVSGKEYVGGVVGEIDYSSRAKIITNCRNKGNVKGTWYVGGVFGASFVDATNSYNTGTVSGETGVGGVVGYSESKISNSYNIGAVKGTGFYIGGVVGRSYKGQLSQGELVNCYYLKGVAVNNKNVVQNGVGAEYAGQPTKDVSSQVTAKKTEQFVSGEVAYLLGEAFGQMIGTEEYPVFDGAKVYYGYNDCGMVKLVYSNSPFSDEIPECTHIAGDVDHDGRITIRDVSTISKHLADCVTLSQRQVSLADANGDGEINISDATYIQKTIAELE